ncbi:hypothetical protein BDW60DRAFT_216662 [Aspergillus nidulans var. acristatus]
MASLIGSIRKLDLYHTVGATGQQGQAVIAAFANNLQYQIRNPSSAAAKDLAAKKSNNKGTKRPRSLNDSRVINMVKAAAVVPTLEHYIWSTLGKTKEEYPVYHFEGKFDVEQTIRAEYPDLHAKITFLLAHWIETAEKYVQFTTYDPETVIPFIGDVMNLTPFIEVIVKSPAEKVRNGAMLIASIAQWTARKWLEEWARARGKMVQPVRISRDDYDALWPWPRLAEEFALMMDYFQFVPVQEWDLGSQPVQTMEEWARTYELPNPSLSTI